MYLFAIIWNNIINIACYTDYNNTDSDITKAYYEQGLHVTDLHLS